MMRLILIFFLFPAVLLAQKKDYRNYDKAVEYYKEGNVEKAKKICLKLINNNEQWDNPHLLMGSIYANFGDIEKAVMYLMNVYDEDDISDVKGIEQIMKNKQAIYDLAVDKRLNKIGSGSKLENFSLDYLPETIKLNLEKYKEWLD